MIVNHQIKYEIGRIDSSQKVTDYATIIREQIGKLNGEEINKRYELEEDFERERPDLYQQWKSKYTAPR
jgi:hypothetical protein